jgi:hypothetical protein
MTPFLGEAHRAAAQREWQWQDLTAVVMLAGQHVRLLAYIGLPLWDFLFASKHASLKA